MKLGDIIRRLDFKQELTQGIKSGFSDLDNIIGRFQGGNLYVLAGRPAMGKSALILNIARNVSLDDKSGVMLFTLEQSHEQIATRFISAVSCIDIVKLTQRNLEDYECNQLVECAHAIEKAPLYILSTSGLTIDELVAQSRKYIKAHNVKLLLVDDIHKLRLGEEQRKFAANREQEVSCIVRELKLLARELRVPIIAVSQLNRNTENRGGSKRPILSDLRDSGAIEDEADVVLLLYREDYYGIIEDRFGKPTTGRAELIVAKHRDGVEASVFLRFIGKLVKFISNKEEITIDEYNSSKVWLNGIDEGQTKGRVRLGTRMRLGKPSSFHDFEDEPPF
ncbi:DnaB-like helicase C-terminal domain-containing protein [uncultured Pontibacter sp.]|uniref:DnaB-like helicase C-terminal domain-containing protein n=1 Tax=uncultured Pontibacter sp. TaxID=453356 RepID=UPI0026238ACA|nr:DnaB-like helicase C-terminal domain-containing protein [uncultured Pontibacter sp.]